MRRMTISAAALASFLLPCASNAADAFSAISVPQAGGSMDVAMSVEDTMAVAKQLGVVSASLSSAAPKDANAAFIVQFGSYNNAEVMQAGARNVSFIAQSGHFNSAVSQQSGTGHQSMVLQRGVGNTSVVSQR